MAFEPSRLIRHSRSKGIQWSDKTEGLGKMRAWKHEACG